ncbi:LuxR C-terminal-related transcriptional regulator [Saccharomonospora cyanea]|uniref:LuxR C-terminal-related transcriptional regulator n=1 Tax=Saccharomonospora cyanea TaxID=40989 RepID=UPI001E5E7855|nr:LuxR C-terminal-related transcriptional regulator [Saccharomonospora cyanea]
MTTADPVSACRFGAPGPPRHHVHRERASRLLARADAVPLVVVAAPAGTGKTTLVAEWVKAEGRSGDTAWVTFDGPGEGLGEPATFWACVVRCLAELGVDVPPYRQAWPSWTWLPSVAAAVVAAGRRLTIVLDDHHLVTADVADDVDLLLRLANGHLRLVFAGRRAPALPLYRYRVAGTVVELGFPELAFDDAEAAALLDALGESPEASEVGALNAYHGGWAAGLLLTGRRRREGGAPGGTAGSDIGSDIDDYVCREVLDPLPPQARRLLLGTCVAGEFDGELAHDLAGPAADRLVRLVECCAFAAATNGGHHAYPPVVRDALRRQLTHETPGEQAEVRTIVARRLRRDGARDAALREFVTAGAWDEAAELLIEDQLVGRLLSEGPDGVVRAYSAPLLGTASRADLVVRAATRLAAGDAAGCADALTRIPGAPTDTALRGCVAALDAVRARLASDADSALAAAEAAQRELGETGTFHPVGPLPTLVRLARGVALLRHGAFDLARAAFEETAARQDGRSLSAPHADCLAHLALTDALEGYLARAEHTATEALTALAALTPDNPGTPFGGQAAAHVALALVALDRCEPGTAWHHATAAEPAPEPLTRHLAQQVTAGVEAAEGHPTAAASRLHAALAEATATDPWTADHLRVEAARLALVEGHPGLALHELGQLGNPHAPTHLDAVVVRAAAHTRRNEDGPAQRALAAVLDGFPPLRPRVEALLVEAERRLRHHSPTRAATVLDASLRLAAPERLRLPFRQAGREVRHLLATEARGAHNWLGRAGDASETARVETLTAREREVLGYLTELLTTEEIAEAMVVSVNTVRTHVRGILRKLGVNRRYAAVRRARELGLLDE